MLVETVGVGQDEVDIVRTVQTTVVVLVPGMGDDIQAIKAGIMEIARRLRGQQGRSRGRGADGAELEMMLSLGEHGDWIPPIVKTVAAKDEGVDRVLAEIERHREHLESSGEMERRRRSHLRLRVETILKERVVAAADRVLGLDREVTRGYDDKSDPYQVADRLFSGVIEDALEEADVEAKTDADAGPEGLTEERMA